MRVQFWGVRGSLPSPLLTSELQSKVSAVLERLDPADLESPGNRKRFLKNLPKCIFGTVGGNTTCVTVELKDSSEILVFDTGSGIREMSIANARLNPKPSRYHIFYTHFHWDHLNGFPFFAPAYNPSVELEFYSPFSDMQRFLSGQMAVPYFPIQMEAMASKKKFHTLSGPLKLMGAKINYRKMNHPGGSYSYKVEYAKKKFIFATDTELSPNDFLKNDENSVFFSDADLLIVDSQYTLGEAIEKYNWGHNSFNVAVDFAANWNIKHVVLFHHDPAYDDQKLFDILESAQMYTKRMKIKGIKISLAM